MMKPVSLLLLFLSFAVAFQAPCVPLRIAQVNRPTCNVLSQRWMSEEPSAVATEEAKEIKEDVPCPNCDLCDGSGRIPGGLGAVFPWIPIKAYRPCPNFVARGGSYQRAGQGLDEIALGKKSD